MEDFRLNALERESGVWKKIEAFLQYKLEVCRKRNDGDLTEGDTAKLRGRIQAIKELLVLGESPQPIDADSTDNPA